MRALLHTEFAALPARAGVSQASFARLTGVTARQVNNWARGRALVPQWAALLAVALQDFSPEALTVSLEEAEFSWHENPRRLAERRHRGGAGQRAKAECAFDWYFPGAGASAARRHPPQSQDASGHRHSAYAH
jgi:transcriptional regulator with XRE-family HTH domain